MSTKNKLPTYRDKIITCICNNFSPYLRMYVAPPNKRKTIGDMYLNSTSCVCNKKVSYQLTKWLLGAFVSMQPHYICYTNIFYYTNCHSYYVLLFRVTLCTNVILINPISNIETKVSYTCTMSYKGDGSWMLTFPTSPLSLRKWSIWLVQDG